ncbi:rRNA maturation RNase YbeY [Cyanobium sp. NIES-981]|uniref:rRNA maturation RNase YbeY n=1 Tax=Cyanobium sp. NIES-981 TaxID=1851505 RepID=UPI0007DD74E4|nr:rRNA maturation RNase YbeY [Cyanobium sp. NIES-981]SBO44917.1 Endoribonuclease YbeY [Cyanobium sp. NIES-981]
MGAPGADPPGLDLAFEAAAGLAAALTTAAGPLADGDAGAGAWQQQLEAWLARLRPELPPRLQARAYSLGLSLVDDAAIAALNQKWRQGSGPTDVLAFAAQDEDLDGLAPPPPGPATPELEAEPLELGDIVISLDTAARQAPEHGHSLEEELLFLASHGLLHLLGWDHPDDASLAAMLARQQELLTPGQTGQRRYGAATP